MGLGAEDRDYLRQLDWLYPADFMQEIRQIAEELIDAQLADSGERQNIREIVRLVMTRLQQAADGQGAAAAEDEAVAAARAAAEQAMKEQVLAALTAGQPETLAGMGPEVIAPLAAVLASQDEVLAGYARQALRALTDGGAIDALCRLWAETRRPELEELMTVAGYLAARPLGLRLLTVLKNGADRSMLREGPELVSELLAAVDDADRVIAGRARRLLLTLTSQPAIDALCETVLAQPKERLTNWAVIARYAPENDSKAALYYCITDQWDKYYALDWQAARPLLAQGYQQATAAERQQFLAAARQSGHSLLLAGLLLESGRQEESGELTDEDWAAMLELLISEERWQELYRLALLAPPGWAAEFVLALDSADWQPRSWEYEDWENIRANCPQTGCRLFVPDGRQLALLETGQAEVVCAAFHPDGQLVAGGCADGRLRLWQAGSGRLWRTANLHDEAIVAVAFTPDGRRLITVGHQGQVQIWQLPEVTWVGSIKSQAGQVQALSAGEAGELLAVACAGGVLPARAWRWDGAYMTTKAQYPGSLFGAAAAAAAQQVVAGGGRDGRIRTYGGGVNQLWLAHNGPVRTLRYSGDGQLLVSTGDDQRLKVWQAAGGALLWSTAEQDKLLAVSRDGGYILLKSPRGRVAVRQLRLNKPLALANHADWQQLKRLLALPDGELPAKPAVLFLHSVLTAKFRYDIML